MAANADAVARETVLPWRTWWALVFIAAVMGLIMLLASFLSMPGCLYITMEGHPVSIHRLEQLQVGTSKSTVKRALGSPHFISGDGCEWTYGSQTWCKITISFDELGQVMGVVHDH